MTRTDAPAPTRLRIRWGRIVATLVLLLAAGYAAAIALIPVPDPTVFLEVEAEQQVDQDGAAAQAAVDAQGLPTAIGWASGEEVWSNDDTAYPLGSVSKLITVLVGLEAHPLEPGSDGPVYTWTDYDRERQDYYLSLDGVAYPVPVGTEITMRQMLTLVFLPSSNDYAEAYANWVFGDNEAFLAAVEAFKAEHGLESLNLVEPTGMDEANRATAADLVRIARIAVDNPTVLEFTGVKSAEMPWGIGLIENTNPLLGEVPGVIGLKTGALSTVGYNLVLAQEADTSGRGIVNLSVTLARPSKEARAESGAIMLDAMSPLPQTVGIVAVGERVGTAVTVTGEEIPLVTDGEAGSVMLPGEAARRTVDLVSLEPGPAGSAAGTVRVAMPTGDAEVPVITGAPITQPGYWWKFTHPMKLFGAPEA